MTERTLTNLREAGHRLTKTRRAIVALLGSHPVPLSADEIRDSLADQKLTVNRTTVYRELAFLRDKGIIHEINFGDGKIRYKSCPEGHHHHIICTSCSRTDAVMMEKDLDLIERRIARATKFRITGHALEFFGVCAECRKS